ncbi:MAG: hypothetical protein EU541_03085 [Promethearchaeota archaeon]|nr:MAG: hypothetical protein EU541_03085 [Candidatus Lokiarchaeota archaeon]
MAKLICSKVVEVDCAKNDFLESIYKPKIWETISPVKKITVEFTAPNVFFSEMYDEVELVKMPIEMSGELVMVDKGEEEGKGRLIELNVRKNKDVKKLDGRLRVKSLGPNKTKIGVFITTFELTSEFLNLFGDTSELILRRKISEILRGLQKYCKSNTLKDFL